MSTWMQWYEDLIGLTEIKDAQNKVIEAETLFAEAQEKRREQQVVLNTIQVKLKAIDSELDKLPRGDDKFLELVKDQHALIRQENAILDKRAIFEKDEKAYFNDLCGAVRDSHEKERARTERTKYWSVIGTVIGSLIGILGATLNSYLRNREIRKLGDTVRTQHEEIESILVDFKSTMGALGSSKDSVTVRVGDGDADKRTQQIVQLIQNQDKNLERQMSDIRKLVLGAGKLGGDNIIYVGPELEKLLANTERNLEYKIKINSLATVAFVYGALALALPILYAMLRGGN